MSSTKKLSGSENIAFIQTLHKRFEKNMKRHKGVDWSKVEARLLANPAKLWAIKEMDVTGGEPDVVLMKSANAKAGEFIFCDCTVETPKERRSLCYDGDALNSRKENKPKGSATELAQEMGINLLTEEQYRELQELGEFDLKTSSWILTPPAIRKLGGALFGDRRYDTVFVYHNGAESYYAARAFRGWIAV